MFLAGKCDEDDRALGADRVERFGQQRQHGERSPGDGGSVVVLGPSKTRTDEDYAISAARYSAHHHALRRTGHGLLDNLIGRNAGFNVLLAKCVGPVFGICGRLRPLLHDLPAKSEVSNRLGTLGRTAAEERNEQRRALNSHLRHDGAIFAASRP